MAQSTRSFRRKRRSQLASAVAASLVIGGVSVTGGCSSTAGARIASMNPFSSSSNVARGQSADGSKSDGKFAGWFGGKKDELGPDVKPADENDPTSLAHKAEVTPEVFVANGRLWESTGNFQKAMESYAKALEKSPNDPEALSNIARLHFRQNNHAKAAEYFGHAVKEKPDDAGLYNDLGLTLSKLGNHNAAASTIERALQLAPKSSRYANNLASVRFEAGDTEGALEVLVKNNQPAVAHFNMAYLHYKHGQKADSTRHLNNALAYRSAAGSDAATKRAIERSEQLLAQIGGVPAGALPPSDGSLPAASQPSGIQIASRPNTDPARGSATPAASANEDPSAGIQAAMQQFKAASAGTSDVKFGAASYRKPATESTKSLDSPTATSQDASTPPTKAAGFALPPNFQLP